MRYSNGLTGFLKKIFQKIPQITSADPYQVYREIPMEIAIYDVQGKYEFVNKLYGGDEKVSKRLLGRTDDFYAELRGINNDSLQKRRQYFQQILEEKKVIQFTEKLHFPGKNQTLYYKRIFQPLFSEYDHDELRGICLFGSSLTFIVQAQKELKYLVYHDKLTGLKNREAFFEEVDQMLIDTDRGELLGAILMCDLDNFKTVNDQYGHKAADFCLNEIAQRISKLIRKSDQVFRVGGDEFAIILRNLNHEYDASRVAEKILHDVSQPLKILDYTINYLSMSIGIAVIPKDGKERDVLIQNATYALKNAKKVKISDFQFFSEELTKTSMARLELENNLRKVVNENIFDNQFEVYYQPIVEKVNNGSYAIIGCEALLRWHNPDLGDVSPAIFIPIAEETDLIGPIGDWVLYKAINDFKSVASKVSHPLYISVNFSAKQMRTPRLVSKVEGIIENTHIRPENLHLEITETSLLDEEIQVLENINALEKLGLRIAIDDFGVGFASLKYLQKFPVSIIKIDRSFIKHINLSLDHQKLVESIIILGKNLNKEIIAEGVENLEHLQVLNTQKCHKYQGFLFSKPLQLQQFEKLLTGAYPFSKIAKLPEIVENTLNIKN